MYTYISTDKDIQKYLGCMNEVCLINQAIVNRKKMGGNTHCGCATGWGYKLDRKENYWNYAIK